MVRLFQTRYLKLFMILSCTLSACRPGADQIDKTTDDEVIYAPGAKVTFQSENPEDPPLVTADAGLICSDLTFYDRNGQLVQGTRDCSASLPDCGEDGQAACVATESNPSFVKSNLESKIIAGEVIGGVNGTAVITGYEACASDGGVGCVTTASFKAADMSRATAANIKAGVTIAGQAGSFPSVSYPLTGATGTADLDEATFNAKIKSAASFEYWTSAGVRQVGTGDADISASNIASGIDIFGASGSNTGAPCSYGAQGTCEADTACRWSGGACELNPWHIRKGITIGGQTGNITFYKNMVDTTTFDRGSNGADVFDTIDDHNNNGSFPTTAPGGWDQATGANWTEVVANDTYKDEITGLVWTDEQGTFTWENAISHCDGLTYGGRSDWRLPTQKELQQAYVNGIWSKKTELSLTANSYWTASSISNGTTNAWLIDLNYGYTYYVSKAGTSRVVCAAP